MQLDDFDFDLPPQRIALTPALPRDSSALMCVLNGAISDRKISDLPSLLRPGDLLVVNDSRVIRAKLIGLRPARPQRGSEPLGPGVAIHANLIRRVDPGTFDALVKPAKRLAQNDQVIFAGNLMAQIVAHLGDGVVRLAFDRIGADLDAHLDQFGDMPLPPYIAGHRPLRPEDSVDYQTVYARQSGSVAAPTAGLHFSPDLLAQLDRAGIDLCAVTLHVGAGTFLPVKAANIADHKMHAEWGEVSAECADKIAMTKAKGGRVIAIGTTALRLMESAMDPTGRVQPFMGETDIFIRPGYQIKTADLLLTNFHLPRSTLLMLVAAFAGYDTMRRGYAHALAGPYRFFSYGDASLWSRAD